MIQVHSYKSELNHTPLSEPRACASPNRPLQVVGILVLAPPALVLAIALFPITIWLLRRIWADDD